MPEGRQSNGDRYSVASVSTDSATGKPLYATASRIQKWSHDGVHGSPSRRTARKIRILRGYGKYDKHVRHRGQWLDVLCGRGLNFSGSIEPPCLRTCNSCNYHCNNLVNCHYYNNCQWYALGAISVCVCVCVCVWILCRRERNSPSESAVTTHLKCMSKLLIAMHSKHYYITFVLLLCDLDVLYDILPHTLEDIGWYIYC